MNFWEDISLVDSSITNIEFCVRSSNLFRDTCGKSGMSSRQLSNFLKSTDRRTDGIHLSKSVVQKKIKAYREATKESPDLSGVSYPTANSLIEQTDARRLNILEKEVELLEKKREARILLNESCVQNLKPMNELPSNLLSNFVKSKGNLKRKATAVVLMSDWHTGLIIDPKRTKGLNEYNTEIWANRIWEHIYEVKSRLAGLSNLYDIESIRIVKLGDDMHNGGLHISSRDVQEIPVWEQITLVARMSQVVISLLATLTPHTEVISIPGNHGRMLPKNVENYVDNLDTIAWNYARDMLVQTLPSNLNVDLRESEPLWDTFNIYDKKFLACHGHFLRSKSQAAIDRASGRQSSIESKMDGERVYATVMGHFHEESLFNSYGSPIVVNGSVCGTDDYAMRCSLHNDASQTMLIVDEYNGIVETHRIPLQHVTYYNDGFSFIKELTRKDYGDLLIKRDMLRYIR